MLDMLQAHIITFEATDGKTANNGSIFGTQATQITTESAQASQSPASQLGWFSSSSSPSFGLSNSSSGSFGNSPFGFNPFTSSSQVSAPSNTSASAPVFGSSTSTSAPFQFGSFSSGFMFGSSALGSTSTPSPFTFIPSSTPPFTFNSSSASTPAFGVQKPAFGFGANSPGNDQMSVEGSMTVAGNQAPTPAFPTFGQPQNTAAAALGFIFGSPAPTQQNPFAFGGVHNPKVQQPFQPCGVVDFNLGGSFSLGSGGGGDKSCRKIIKVKRGLRGRK